MQILILDLQCLLFNISAFSFIIKLIFSRGIMSVLGHFQEDPPRSHPSLPLVSEILRQIQDGHRCTHILRQIQDGHQLTSILFFAKKRQNPFLKKPAEIFLTTPLPKACRIFFHSLRCFTRFAVSLPVSQNFCFLRSRNVHTPSSEFYRNWTHSRFIIKAY